jgi:hypothetical protein
MEGMRMNKPLSIIVVNPDIGKLVTENDGYCPCAIERTPDTKCICKAFWEQDKPGECHCGRFAKVYVGEDTNVTTNEERTGGE